MAGHGVPRLVTRENKSIEARERERKEIEEYKSLVDFVKQKVAEKDFSPELLERTGALLQKNPEYYTIWNIRRRIYSNEFQAIQQAADNDEITLESKISQVLDIIHLDLGFLFTLLLKFPKCYWIWNHRIWLLQQSSILLPSDKARKIWEDELGLVGKMLTRDSRNFHGWGYRKFIVQNLESATLNGESMTRSEFSYTKKMIGSNLSNFSAWHSRMNLILSMMEEEQADPAERRKMLDEELALIHKALFDPYDQSLWYYHQILMNAFDPERCQVSIAPQLTQDVKLEYVGKEMEFLEELLEDVDDCKWVYQALIECAAIQGKLLEEHSPGTKVAMRDWLQNLKKLDPLRAGRWNDTEASLV